MNTSPWKVALAAALFLACGSDDDAPSFVADATTDAATDSGNSGADAEADAGMGDVADETDAAGSDDTADAGAPAVTLSQVHEQIFAPTCAGSGCHIDGASAAGINLDNDGTLRDRLLGSSSVRGLPQVTPGELSESYLYLKMTGEFRDVRGSGSVMPLGRSPLSSDQLQLVADWILAGAPE